MALSPQVLGYGLVGLAGLVLFAHGEPPHATGEARTPTTAAVSSDPLARTPFRDASVELPASDRMFPDGAGADLANGNCLSCHSADMVLYQPPLPFATWTEEVNKMRRVFRAPVEAGDVQAIAAYLAATREPR